jgi:hypothetical protein
MLSIHAATRHASHAEQAPVPDAVRATLLARRFDLSLRALKGTPFLSKSG